MKTCLYRTFTTVAFGLAGMSIAMNANAQESAKPKLVVGIVVDQMCYEYLYRFYDQFGEDGFRKMMREGVNCRSTHYNYVPTYTGPGHASIYTGTTPANHGIVGNDWYDRTLGTEINCVGDQSVTTVGSASTQGACSPRNLKSVTITDQLRMTYSDSKVISMSIKNRGAILPGGHLSNGSYWFDFTTGDFVTSSYFKKTLPQWVTNFNKQDYPQQFLRQKWETYRDIATYTESDPDDSPYEYPLPGKTQSTFPYNLPEMAKPEFQFDLFTATPFANTYLTDFALGALKNEQLGKDSKTDMLCISYSTPDIIGHYFGPQSKEIEDTYIRLDVELARLFEALDKEVGEGEYVVFLTADHAVVPVPQYFIDHQMPGGYVFLDAPLKALKADLATRFGDTLILAESNLNLYVDHGAIERLKLDTEEVTTYIRNKVAGWEGVKQAYTADQLNTQAASDKWGEMVKQGYHPHESGDVLFILESGYLPKHVDTESGRKGTSHGSPFSYDTHVPLLWYGQGIEHKEVFRVIDIIDIVPTLAHLLNVSFPHVVTGKPIVEVLE